MHALDQTERSQLLLGNSKCILDLIALEVMTNPTKLARSASHQPWLQIYRGNHSFSAGLKGRHRSSCHRSTRFFAQKPGGDLLQPAHSSPSDAAASSWRRSECRQKHGEQAQASASGKYPPVSCSLDLAALEVPGQVLARQPSLTPLLHALRDLCCILLCLDAKELGIPGCLPARI